MLKRESIQPLYRQLMEELTSLIDKGVYQNGQQIPTEPELAEQYGVSRITVRRTIEEMCKIGYLVKRQGKGTFVNPPKVFRKFRQDMNLTFTEACIENKYTPKAKTILLKEEKAVGDIAEYFQLKTDDNILRLQRIWQADDTPIMLIDIFMDPDTYSDFNIDILETSSFFEYLSDSYGIHCSENKNFSFSCTNATNEQAQLLNVSIGDSLLMIEHYEKIKEGEAIYFTRQFIVGSRYVATF